MCICQRKIYTNSHFLSSEHYLPFEFYVPCGHCVECASRKRLDYGVRAYYEAKRCIDKGGFIVFDTLTYGDFSLPKISDHWSFATGNIFDRSCFNRRNVVNFLKLLRRWLATDGYDVNDNLRYFITSEYGTDEDKTHRPHYHCLFYVNFDIDPCIFSNYISVAWSYGRTDGVFWKGKTYFRNKRLFRKNDAYAINCINYVSKYVGKDSYYTDLINKNLESLFDSIDFVRVVEFNEIDGVINWREVKSLRDLHKWLKRQVSEFHLESREFGGYALERYSAEDLLTNNNILVPDGENKPFKWVPLPAYYQRKLMYETYWFNGHRFWRLSPIGMKFKKVHLFNNVNRLLRKLNGWFESAIDQRQQIINLLKGRTLYDVAYYSVALRGRIIPFRSPAEDIKDIPFISLCDQVTNINSLIHGGICLYPYNHSNDIARFGRRFVSDHYIGDSTVFQYSRLAKIKKIGVMPSDEFKEKFTIHEYDFDTILNLFQCWLSYFGALKQKKRDEQKFTKYQYQKHGILTHSI